MEASKRVAVVSWFFLLGVGLAAAQDKKIGVEAIRKFQHTAEIVSMYDKRKDQTTIVMDWYNVYRGLPDDKHPNSVEALDNRVDIHAGFIFAGRSLSSPPEAVEFGIKVGNVGGPVFKNGDAPELTAVVDGETISLGNVTVVKARISGDNRKHEAGILRTALSQLHVSRITADRPGKKSYYESWTVAV